MSPCPCAPAALTAVRLGARVVLLRCSAHEHQVWQVDGRTADSAEALDVLRTVFVDERGRRRTAPAAVPKAPRPTPPPAPPAAAAAAAPVEPTEAGTDAALTALLHARGLTGTWAVA